MYCVLLLILSVLPVAVLGVYIYRKDKNREPAKLLRQLFIGGLFAVFIVLRLSDLLELLSPFFARDAQELSLGQLAVWVFVKVALVEEGCKWLVTHHYVYDHPAFDESFDAVLYCAFTALGFACLENLMYIFSSGEITTAILRGILSVPGHFCFGVAMGGHFAKAKAADRMEDGQARITALWKSVLVPTALHGVYDFLLFSENGWLLLSFVPFVIWMFVYTLRSIRKAVKQNRSFNDRDEAYFP